MEKLLTWLWAQRVRASGMLAIGAFGLLVGRFWHPYYGFTIFLQFDTRSVETAIHEIREQPLYVFPGAGGYDAIAYAQIAFHPLLDSPELGPAVGNVPYRARRILGSAVAWLLAGGAPERIANTYAALNLGVWLVLAGLLWRLLPVNDGRSWLAWAGLLFSAGALHCVRLALPDLPALTLLVAAMLLAERQRAGAALGALAAAGLARETVLSGVVALWRGPWRTIRAWRDNLGRTLMVALPLMAWMAYVRWKAGSANQGTGNFTWPLVSWVEKWVDTFADLGREPAHTWLIMTTLLTTLGVTVQAIYLLRHREPGDVWWRLGAVNVVMMAMLGTSVWEGQPGAATRVLLPMSLAVNVLMVRRRAALAWLLAANLTVCSGVLALWHVPGDARELAAGRGVAGGYVVKIGQGWYGCEHYRRDVWAWSPGRGQIEIATQSRVAAVLRMRLGLRSVAPGTAEIRQDAAVLWRGPVDATLRWIEFPGVRTVAGRAVLEVSTDAPPVREKAVGRARSLGLALYDPRVK